MRAWGLSAQDRSHGMWQTPNRDQEKGVMSPFPTTSSNLRCQQRAALNRADTFHPAQKLVRVKCSPGGQGWHTHLCQLKGSVHILNEARGREGSTKELFHATFHKWHFVNGNPGSRCDYFFAHRYCPKLKISISFPLIVLLFGSCFLHPLSTSPLI